MFKAVIIGCGQIGANYDTPEADHILTHAHAYHQVGGVELIGVIDPDLSKAAGAGKNWRCEYFTDIKTCLEKLSPDVVSICSPTEKHQTNIVEVIKHHKPGVFFCEKPITDSVENSKAVIQILRERQIPLVVNYLRRWTSLCGLIRNDMETGATGAFLTGCCVYNKGMLNNGSHLIDLIRNILGEIDEIVVLNGKVDYHDLDPSLDLYLHLKDHDGGVHMLATDKNYCYTLELDLFFEKKRYRMPHIGRTISIHGIVPCELFQGYKEFDAGREVDTGMDTALGKAVENIRDFLTIGTPLVCQGEDALVTQKICETAINKFNRNLEL